MSELDFILVTYKFGPCVLQITKVLKDLHFRYHFYKKKCKMPDDAADYV
jgi:hypothetical protein